MVSTAAVCMYWTYQYGSVCCHSAPFFAGLIEFNMDLGSLHSCLIVVLLLFCPFNRVVITGLWSLDFLDFALVCLLHGLQTFSSFVLIFWCLLFRFHHHNVMSRRYCCCCCCSAPGWLLFFGGQGFCSHDHEEDAAEKLPTLLALLCLVMLM
jgi:hypothetical protein